ncbi:MAG: metal ABC transporter substrate-binding protein [Clostridiales bacterium GWB2_37_7]|nr:MAG: metal ABC transporter substrate-binding protein [Clostridiales bacterium GWB2_37_7]
MKLRIIGLVLVLVVLFTTLTACAGKEEKKITFGVAPGPYGDMIKKGIQPALLEKGYKVELKEFSDYVQPNLALSNKEINVNLFQHTVYLEKFAEDRSLQLSPVIIVPTAGVGIYSKKIKSLEELQEGSQVAIPNDPTNLSRALRLLQAAKLITIKSDIDPTKASEKDIVENPKNLKIVTLEAAQLPRSLETTDLAVINGNFAISAGIPLSTALVMEKLAEEYKNVIAVRTEDLDKEFVKDIKAVVESEAFFVAIEDDKQDFKSFQKPDWYKQKYNK